MSLFGAFWISELGWICRDTIVIPSISILYVFCNFLHKSLENQSKTTKVPRDFSSSSSGVIRRTRSAVAPKRSAVTGYKPRSNCDKRTPRNDHCRREHEGLTMLTAQLSIWVMALFVFQHSLAYHAYTVSIAMLQGHDEAPDERGCRGPAGGCARSMPRQAPRSQGKARRGAQSATNEAKRISTWVASLKKGSLGSGDFVSLRTFNHFFWSYFWIILPVRLGGWTFFNFFPQSLLLLFSNVQSVWETMYNNMQSNVDGMNALLLVHLVTCCYLCPFIRLANVSICQGL